MDRSGVCPQCSIGGVETEKFETLVKPSYEVDECITALTGIANEILSDAPNIEECIGLFKEFVGDDLIVGYNVNFDINFLYDNLLRCCSKEL